MEPNGWRKSSYSNGQGQCVEVNQGGPDVRVRDSKDPLGGELTFSPNAWQAFVEGIQNGEFGPAA